MFITFYTKNSLQLFLHDLNFEYSIINFLKNNAVEQQK